MGNSFVKDIGTLYKLRLGFFVVMSSVLGWFMGAESIDIKTMLLLTVGGYLLTGASNGLNQIFEKYSKIHLLSSLMLNQYKLPSCSYL